jgi:hypothetical protein
MVKYGNGASIRILLINACVNENGPTPLAMPLYAQAAMSSVTPFPSSVVQTPDAQQSKRIKTSERDSSSVFCIPDHFTVGQRSLRLFCQLEEHD